MNCAEGGPPTAYYALCLLKPLPSRFVVDPGQILPKPGCAVRGHAQTAISATEAKDHVGETTTVCGEVASAHYAAKNRGNPTFINLDKPYPNEIFTVLIWGSDRPKFGDPEESCRSKHIRATAASRDDCVEATRISRQTVWQRVKRGELRI